MNLLDFTPNLWPSLARGTIQGSLALIAVYLACRLIPRLPAWTKSWLWRLAWLRVIIAFATAASVGLAILPPPKPTSVYATFTASLPPQLDAISSEPNTNTPTTPAPSYTYSSTDYLMAIWFLGIVLMLARLAYHYRGARQLRATATACADAAIIAKLKTLSIEFGVRAPRLLISTKITKPLLTGIFKPAIILPPTASSLAHSHIELILKHELAHLKRRDLAWNALAAVAQTLLWFNPLIWLCERECRFTQETACDELALGSQTNRVPELANLLVEFAAQRERRPQLLTVSIIRTANTLERRLKAMKTLHRKGPRQLIGAYIVALALMPVLVPWRAIAQKPDTADTPGNVDPPAASDIPAAISTNEERLLGEEIKLARQQLDAVMRANQNGAASSEDVIRQKGELQKLERDLAGLHNDTPKIRASLQDEIKDFEKLQASAQQRVQNGVASPEEKLKIDRELLRLKRELASLDRLEPAAPPNVGSGAGSNMSMMYYMSNPELMKRYFPQMYAMMMKNGGTNAFPSVINPPNNAQAKFQDRLNRAYSERSVIRLQPKRPGVVISVVVKSGDHVKAGDDLVRLDDREARISLRAAESEFAIAKADYALKKKELENNLKWNQNTVKNASDEFKKSQQEDHDLKLTRLDSELRLASIKVEQTQLQLDDLTIKAPSDGIVGKVPFAGQTLTDASMAIEFLPDPQK